MELFYLSEGSYFGDPIAEITEYKEGYLLKSYSPEEPCLAFDYISKEDGEELIKHKDNPNKAFDGCGVEEVFRHKYIRLKEIFDYDDIIQAIIDDKEVCNFMEKVCSNKSGIRDSFTDYMFNKLDEAEKVYIADVGFLDDENMSMNDLCHNYIAEINSP